MHLKLVPPYQQPPQRVVNSKVKYKFYSDPGHGWLVVPMKELIELGIAERISRYSYLDPVTQEAFLEEDCDAGLFMSAANLIPNNLEPVDIKDIENLIRRRRLVNFTA